MITIKIKSAEAARQLGTSKLGSAAGQAAKGSALAVKGGALGPHAHPIVASTPLAHAFPLTTAGGGVKAGTLWSGTGTSLGLGLGLGFYGPILLVASLGLMATGIYIYVRSKQIQTGGDEAAAS